MQKPHNLKMPGFLQSAQNRWAIFGGTHNNFLQKIVEIGP